jgi:hypothetical protein
MMPRLGRLRMTEAEIARLLAVVVGVCFPFGVRAEVKNVHLEDLAAHSDLIVVAKVLKIEDAPAQLERDHPGMPPLKVATAEVTETWKGNPVRQVRYIASPDRMGDTSHGEKGERVLLFLTHAHWRKDRSFRSISHAGRGRMPLREVVRGKWHAAHQDEVILPPGGATTILAQKTVRITLARSEQNQPASVISCLVPSVELGRLRELVKSTTPGK